MLQLPLVVTKDSGGEKSLKNATEATSHFDFTLCIRLLYIRGRIFVTDVV